MKIMPTLSAFLVGVATLIAAITLNALPAESGDGYRRAAILAMTRTPQTYVHYGMAHDGDARTVAQRLIDGSIIQLR